MAGGKTQLDMNEESRRECATLSLLFQHNCAGKKKRKTISVVS